MFQIDALSRTPVYEQIVEQCEQFLLKGVFTVGDKLPSVRQLSVELAINPNTIQKAYLELDRRGLVTSVPGRGVFISEGAFMKVSEDRRENLGKIAELTKELKLAGVKEEEIIDSVRTAYKED